VLKSIYARTFMLMLASIVFAQAIALMIPLGPWETSQREVSLEQIAQRLASHPPPAPPDFDGPPPRDFSGPPPEAPPDLPPRGEFLGLREQAIAPLAGNLSVNEAARARLAQLTGQPLAAVLFFSPSSETGASERFARSFVAATHEQNRWRIVSREVESFPTHAQRRLLAVLMLELLALLPLAWLFARALSAPIRRFAEAAKRVGQDPNTAPLLREGPAEMQDAVDSFNNMQSRLNRLIEERTRMVAAIAHDLRTPLTRLAFRLDELPGTLGEKVRDDLQEMRAMISAALDFIRDRHFSAPRERLDLRSLVERVVNDQADLGHDVTLSAGPALIVEGAPIALRRMVSNLVENAVKYGERARVQLGHEGASCRIQIEDDGPGIPENLQEQVFEPFFRVEASRSRETGGIGLGLAAVRAIAMEHGGEVRLGNPKSGGLRVVVTLPLHP
jgi:two-component system OmpR family sensor kinase